MATDTRAARRSCPACGLFYDADVLVCPDDGSDLPPPAQDAIVGAVIDGRYKVHHFLDEGGVCKVYKGTDQKTGAAVAVKVLNADCAETDEIAKRFQREADATYQMNDPRLISIMDYGLHQGRPYMVVEFIDGRTLSSILDEQGHLPIETALDVFTGICQGMDHAHKLGIVHRDLKPNNVMMGQNPDGTAFIKILDFGLAKFISMQGETLQRLSKTGQIFGTIFYLSPEQIRGQAVDGRCDVYAVGCMMYEILTGLPPFMGDDVVTIMEKHLATEPMPCRQARPDLQLPESLEVLVHKAISKDPAQRHQSMHELLEEISAIRASLSSLS